MLNFLSDLLTGISICARIQSMYMMYVYVYDVCVYNVRIRI